MVLEVQISVGVHVCLDLKCSNQHAWSEGWIVFICWVLECFAFIVHGGELNQIHRVKFLRVLRAWLMYGRTHHNSVDMVNVNTNPIESIDLKFRNVKIWKNFNYHVLFYLCAPNRMEYLV